MKIVYTFLNIISDLKNKHQDKFVNIFFLIFITSFFIDRILFSFVINFPFFVVSALLVFPFLFLATQNKNLNKYQLYVLIFTFIIITILNSIVFLFGNQNISDLLFIILFITIYFYYKENIIHLKVSNAYVFLILSLFLFSFTFFNIDSDTVINSGHSKSSVKYRSYFHKSIPFEKKTAIVDTTKSPPIYVDKFKPYKIRHSGLFRRTHMASYFLGFLFLFFAFKYQKNKRVFYLIIIAVSIVFCFYTGIRSIPTAFVFSGLLFLFKRKYIYYLLMLLTAIALLIITNEYFLQLTKDTVFYQFIYLIHTIKDNFTSLPRFQLYQSWWTEVHNFGFIDFLIGKSFMNALLANGQNFGAAMWFHNDFLNIFYTYGILGVSMYIWFFVKIYRDNKREIKQNVFIFIFYTSMIITAVINGYYYYFPVFLLYIFFLMIKKEKEFV